MKIWVFNHYATPLGGKTASRHAVLGKHLRRLGHDVTVFASALTHGAQEPAHSGEFPRGARWIEEHRDGVRWRFIRATAHHNNRQRFVGMRRYCADATRAHQDLAPPDIVIGSCVHPYAVEAAIRVARERGAPFVYEIRDIWPESLADVGGMSRWHPVYMLFRRMELRALRESQGVITLLPGVTDYVAHHGVAVDKVCYLPNGIDPEAFADVRSARPHEGFLCSYFGAHGPANNLDNVVDAAAILLNEGDHHIRFRLIGDGPAKSGVVRRAASLGLTNIEFRDPVVWTELRQLASESDAFVFNLMRMPVIERYGLSANKLFEYLVNARPVVFACSSYNNPVAEADAGVTVAPADPRAMAEALRRLARMDPSSRAEMGRRGRSFVLANHAHDRLARRLEAFLETTVSPRVATAA